MWRLDLEIENLLALADLGGPGDTPIPPLTPSFEAPKFSILGPYMIFPYFFALLCLIIIIIIFILFSLMVRYSFCAVKQFFY